MKIVFCVNSDIYGLFSLSLLSEIICNNECLLFLSDKILRKKNIDELDTLHFIEQESINIDTPTKTESILLNKLKIIGINGEINNNINDIESHKKIREFSPNVIISIRYGFRIKKHIIDIPKFGVINFHSGLLPLYQGVIPTFWSLLNKEDKIGATIHIIDSEEIDTGPIIGSVSIPANPKMSLVRNIFSVYKSGIPYLSAIISSIAKNESIALSPQNNGTYYSFPTIHDIAKFRELGLFFYENGDHQKIIRSIYEEP